MPAKAGIQEHIALAAGATSWIPGLALLARNDELRVFVIPAQADRRLPDSRQTYRRGFTT